MQWLNLPTRTLHATAYIGADPSARATWLNLMLWCAEQENGGTIADARAWSDRRWQQTCGVTAHEVTAAAPLVAWTGDSVTVWGYPAEKQAEVQAKREAGRKGGKSKSDAKSQAARSNGTHHKPQGNPSTTQAEPKQEPNGKERKGKESIAPAGAVGGPEAKPDPCPKKPRERNPLIDAIAAVDGSDPAQVTGKAWGGIAAALNEIREVCPQVTPEEIRRRAAHYRQHMPGAMLTPHALAKHWATCDHPPAAPWERGGYRPANEQPRVGVNV